MSEYDKIFNKQNLNIVEKVTDYEVGATHYLPHRPAIREDKETLKLVLYSMLIVKVELKGHL